MSNLNNPTNQPATIHAAIEAYRAKLVALGAPEYAIDLATVSFIAGVVDAAKVVQQFKHTGLAALSILMEVNRLKEKYAPESVKQAAAAAEAANDNDNDLNSPPEHERN